MKIKTNSTLPQLAFAIMLFSSCFTQTMPTPNKGDLVKSAAFFQAKGHDLAKALLAYNVQEGVRTPYSNNETLSTLQLERAENHAAHQSLRDQLVHDFAENKDVYSLRSQVKHVRFVNNLHNYFALANSDDEIAENLARHFDITVNGVAIPYDKALKIPVIDNHCKLGVNIPKGKLSKVMRLGEALLRKSVGFMKDMSLTLIDRIFTLINNQPSFSFHCLCKLELEDDVADDELVVYISDLYASHPVFQDNFNLKTIYQEVRTLRLGADWADLQLGLTNIKH
jgi:hypothetical protein